MKGGSHGDGRVNIEISPVLGSGSGGQQRDDWSREWYSNFITFLTSITEPIPSKNNIAQKTYVLAPGS